MSNVSIALFGGIYYLCGPQGNNIKSVATGEFANLFAYGDRPYIHYEYVALGENRSYYTRSLNLRVGKSRTFYSLSAYPGLDKRIQDNPLGEPICISLGENGNYFINDTCGRAWSLPRDVEDHINIQNMDDLVEKVWLGKGGSYLAQTKRGALYWNFKGNYPLLNDALKYNTAGIRCLAMDLQDGISFFVLFKDYRTSYFALSNYDSIRSNARLSNGGWQMTEFDAWAERLREDMKNIQPDYVIQHDNDRRSVQSVETSTTLISAFSDSTVVERSATVELERVFQEDAELIGLYRLALKDASMEPEKLQRNVARLLQYFAKDLHREAGGNLERIASRFVRSKAQYIAQCIVEKFHDTPRELQHQQEKADEESGGWCEPLVEVVEAQLQANYEQPEADNVDETIDEDYFEDLAMLRNFLPKDWHPLDVDAVIQDRSIDTSSSRFERFLIATSQTFKSFLVMAGCLEPALQPGFIRLRWQCECGAPLFGDVQEYCIGGVSRLMEQMERSIGGKVTATSYNKKSPSQQYVPITWFGDAVENIAKVFSREANRNAELPRHNDPSTTVISAPFNTASPPIRDLLLLTCVNESQGGQILCQDSIGAMENDRQLFHFIQEQVSRNPSKRWPSRLLKTVTGIHFTQFHLRLNDDVEPRPHKLCCRLDSCQCIPLTSNAEYDCKPAGPLDFGPPVLPSKMLHHFQHPELIAEKEMSILNQLPKRNCGKLQSTGQAPAEGWGLYYEENWNFGLIIVLIVVITTVASLIFGIWWTLAKMDIQGAWGVSSYMVTTCALVVGLVSIIGRASSS